MSDVASTVKEIIVEKLGVKESEVTPEANFTKSLMIKQKKLQL